MHFLLLLSAFIYFETLIDQEVIESRYEMFKYVSRKKKKTLCYKISIQINKKKEQNHFAQNFKKISTSWTDPISKYCQRILFLFCVALCNNSYQNGKITEITTGILFM